MTHQALRALLWSATALLTATLVIPAALHAGGAARTRNEAFRLRDAALSHAAVLARVGPTPPSPAPLTQAVTGALAGAGLPPGLLASVSPDPAPASTGPSRRTATIVLSNIALPELGRLLAAWPAHATGWTVVELRLEPAPTAPSAPPGPAPLRVVVRAEAIEPGRPALGDDAP